jgi:hypothetical protein
VVDDEVVDDEVVDDEVETTIETMMATITEMFIYTIVKRQRE